MQSAFYRHPRLAFIMALTTLMALVAVAYAAMTATTSHARDLGGVCATHAKGALEDLKCLEARAPARSDREFLTRDGRAITLEELDGKLTLVNFWATWCAPCKREMPSLDELQYVMGSNRFEVVAISLDANREDALQFYDTENIATLGIYLDPSRRMPADVDARGMPTTILYGPDGREIARYEGHTDWASKEAMKLIEDLVDYFERNPSALSAP